MFWSNLENVRVLLVEDDDDHAVLITRALKRSARPQFTVEHVKALSEIKEGLARHTCHVVLLDLNLSDSAFHETLSFIDGTRIDQPVVVTSSLSAPDVIERALNIGAQDYIEKQNITTETLSRSLCYAIERMKVTAKLNRQNEELRRFAHVVAHEVKSQLQTPMMALSLLAEENERGNYYDKTELTSMGMESLSELSEFTTQMLNFSRLESVENSSDRVNMNEVLESVIKSVSREFDVSGVSFETDFLPEVFGSKTQILHLILNLVRNSLKHGRKEGEALCIRIGVGGTEDNFIRFFVMDDGRGISDSNQSRMFQFFYSGANKNDGVGGTGIGLGFCRQILRHYNCDISFDTPPGGGARFTFTLPKITQRKAVLSDEDGDDKRVAFSG